MPPSARAFATRATSVGERARIAGSVVIAVVFLYALFGGVGHKLTGTRYGQAPHIVNLPSASLARTPSATRAPLCSGWATPGAAPPEDAASCPPPEWGAKYANYQADDLIRLDVNSHNRPPEGGWSAASPPPVRNAAACADACAKAEGCNVWAFCADYASGCGECFPQAANHAAPGPESAKFGRYGGCTADGTYPYGTCSLKKAADPSSPKPAGDGDYDSWISGARAAGGGVAGGGAGGDTASGQAADAAGATDIIPEADAHAKPGAGAAGGAHTVKTAAEKAAATGVGKGAADEWP